MTGFDSKRQAAQDKLDDDADTLLIVYQRGFADGKRAAQPAQEPVALVIDGVLVKSELPEKYTGHLYTTPPAAQPEPLEYWNAVEGWVKIDEVREHFDSVGCGTIYRTAGEDRVPVYTALPAAQRPWQGLTDEEMSDAVADMDVDFGDLLWKVVCLTKLIEAKLKERNDY